MEDLTRAPLEAPTVPHPAAPAAAPDSPGSSGSPGSPGRSGRPGARLPRLALLDGLRFVAAAAVVAYHFTAIRSGVWKLPGHDAFPHLVGATRYGYLGVYLFFFISGFVILMSAWGKDVTVFAASRVGRLMPAYWTGVLATGLLVLGTGTLLNRIKPLDMVTNLTMVQAAFGVGHIDGAYWTLWVELRFYLLIGVLSLIGLTRNRILGLCAVWPVVGALAASQHDGFMDRLLIADCAPFFAVGMLLYLAYREGWSPLLVLVTGFNLALSVTRAVEIVRPVVRSTGVAPNPFVAAAVIAACFVVVTVATTTRLASWGGRWATTLGLLTYPLYVIHEYWGLWVVHLLLPHTSRAVALLAAVVAVLGLAWLIHRFVERPFGPRLRSAVLAGFRAPGAGHRQAG